MAAAAVTHVVLRVGVGLLLLQHGLQKLFGFFGAMPVPLASRLGAAGVIELVGERCSCWGCSPGPSPSC